MARRLSHVDADGRPGMVDVGAKPVTRREATAVSIVVFPADAAAALHAAALKSAKGPVLETATIAGTLAAKRTHELIPFCHPLPLERIRFEHAFATPARLEIRCTVAAEARTGVEMEALVGASVAALTVYDMCKALTLGIEIVATRVLAKRGGRRDFGAATAPAAAGDTGTKRSRRR
jgi:cyclic pyranopterin phosphate synthase